MRSYVVTGANKGVGLAIVERILKEIDESFVFLCSRSVERGNKALETLAKEEYSFTERVRVIELDVSSADSITNAVKTIEVYLNENQDKAPLEGLVNNAGVMTDNLEQVLQINFFGAKQVTDLLLPLMNKTGRVVHITSGSAGMFVQKCNDKGVAFFKNKAVEWSQLTELIDNFSKDVFNKKDDHLSDFGLTHSDFSPYGFSKALMNSLTMIQAREQPTMKINACTPGWIMTDMTLGYAQGDPEKAKSMGMKTPFEGASSALHLLTSNSLKGNGLYYGSDCLRSPLHKYRAANTPEYDGSED